MFKKNISVAGVHQLGGKDAKKFRQKVASMYPHLSDSELAVLIPSKSITQTKLNNRAILFSIDNGNPLFFDSSGHGDHLLPTIYCLALCPGLLPTLYTTSDVSPKLIGGADLFLQGILTSTAGLPDFLTNSFRTVSIIGNPCPFAVGMMAVSSTEALREGMKGRGLTVLHVYGDLLWQLGDQTLPNVGFTKNKVLAIASPPKPGTDGDQNNQHIDTPMGEGEEPAQQQRQLTEELAALSMAAAAAADDDDTATADGDAKLHQQQGVDLDMLLEQAVIGGIHTLKASEMPIMTSNFYTLHMQPLKPEGVTFDFKQSKYKKLSRLLEKLEKDKLIKLKCIRKLDHITDVNRSHPLYTAYSGIPTNVQPGTTEAICNGGTQKKSNGTKNKEGGNTGVEYLYKPPNSLRPLFCPEGGSEKDRLYTEQEVAEMLQQYADSQGLLSGAGPSRNIKIDHLFATTLWGKKEGPGEGSSMPYGALLARLLTKLQMWHHVSRMSDTSGQVVQVTRKGVIKPITVVAEKRHGRNVTAVAHVESFGFYANEVAAGFQKKFQTSCTVNKLPGKNEQDEEIMLQGDLLKGVVDYMVTVMGIDKKYIDSNSKLKN